MKNFILPFIALFVSNQIFSQSSILLSNNGTATTLAPNESIYVTTQAVSNTKVTIDIKNVGSTTQSYIAKRYDVLLNTAGTSTAEAYFCIAGSCYGPPTIISPTPLTLNSMQSASELQGQYQMLVADLDEATAVGQSIVKYTFQNTNNANDSVQISIKYNATPAGIKKTQLAENKFSISPNPTTDNLNILFNSDLNTSSEIILYNSLGEIVLIEKHELNSGKNNIKININNLSKGVYVASLQTTNSTITKKFVIN